MLKELKAALRLYHCFPSLK